ncbi:PucR family transcriptional regulator [Rubrobacter xylanophilus]|uniref:PucR family transcriptional regulator n=1 Tax=Rubrobacter xylanophilus TaxID=49319 RepID=UPI001C64006F|nr:PucR family transcriptional regulator [Rubrobacter xylanophilus]
MEPTPPITLRDFVEDGELGLEVVVGGDLGRPVSWVHVTELLDPAPYMGGGELILSAGVWSSRGGRGDVFVGGLVRGGAVALGWGLLYGDERVPENVVRACRSAGLPLLAVPVRTPFIAVGRWFFERLQEHREAALRETVARSERLVRAISALPGGVRGILQELRGMLGREVRIAEAAGAADPGWSSFPVDAGGSRRGSLLVEGTELSPRDLTTVRQALPLLGFVISYERELREAELRLAGELIEAVLSRRSRFAAGRLGAYGLDPEGAFFGAAVLGEGAGPEAARRALAAAGLRAVAASWRGAVYAAVQPGDVTSPEVAARTLAAAFGSGAAVGVGGRGAGVEGLRRSLIQARQAAGLARMRRPPEGYVVHERAESHALLLALQDEEVLAAFRDSLLGPLEAYDAAHGTSLLETLGEFLASGGRWQDTARRLHIHVNTLRHRLARCEELTGRSLSSMDDRVDLYLALRAGEGGSRSGRP